MTDPFAIRLQAGDRRLPRRRFAPLVIGAKLNRGDNKIVDALVEKLDARLREWKPETADAVRERVTEVMELADEDVLDLMRSRGIEQEVLDLIDEPTTR